MSHIDIWTIYDHPKDYPDCFIARRFENDKPTSHILTAPSLVKLRATFLARGLACLARHPTDDPVIVETWL